jgi:PAS domain S-box-containing protein
MFKDRVFYTAKSSAKAWHTLLPEAEKGSYEKFFRLAPDMLCILGFDGYFRDVNASFQRNLGYNKKELLGSALIHFVSDEARQNAYTTFVELKNGKTSDGFETAFKCKNGTVKSLAWRCVILEEEQLIYAVAQDITPVKDTESLYKKQTANLQELIINTNEGLQYAKLLQEAIFHDPKTLNLTFTESFIFHSSKDILSGDFYWFERINNKAYVACADCTGHGVAGAMLSVLGINKLHEIISSRCKFSPSQILDRLNYIIYNALGKKHGTKKMSDGMDVALFSVDFLSYTLDFSGAYNPLYIVRNGQLISLEADKQSIGNSLDVKFFTNHTFQLEKGDMVYASSDGYADQFGGEKGKKFTRRRFKELLIAIAPLNTDKQKQVLEQTLTEWRKEFEQTDDICVIGIRIK